MYTEKIDLLFHFVFFFYFLQESLSIIHYPRSLNPNFNFFLKCYPSVLLPHLLIRLHCQPVDPFTNHWIRSHNNTAYNETPPPLSFLFFSFFITSYIRNSETIGFDIERVFNYQFKRS